MEVDFILCSLFMFCLTVCVGLRPLPVNCTGCFCKSYNGAKLFLDDVFDTQTSKNCNKSTYIFPSCLNKVNGSPLGNHSSDLVCISNDTKQICLDNGIICIHTEVANNSRNTQHWTLDDDAKQCHIVITCSLPEHQMDDKVVFKVSDCGRLKDFVSSARANITPSTKTAPTSSANITFSSPLATPSSSSSSAMPSSPSATPSSPSATPLSPSATPSSPSATPSLPSATPSSPSVIPNSSSTVVPSSNPPSTDNSDTSKLLYIVIPTAAPAAFVISFITSFCILNWCHQRNKKKLYIKLTSTIYSEDESSDDSDD